MAAISRSPGASLTRYAQRRFAVSDLQPHFDKDFRCIGPACEDMCCDVWNVFLDKRTYEKYQTSPDLRAIADQHFVHITEAPTDSKYALVNFPGPSRICPFLAEDRWCNIHKEHGPAYLPPVCHTYPRVQRSSGSLTRNLLHLSCPEAARLVLLQKEFVPIDRNVDDNRPRLQRFLRMTEQPAKSNGSTHNSDILTFAILLVQDRAYQPWERLFMLGMFSQRLAALSLKNQTKMIPTALADFAGMVKHMRLQSVMDSVPAQTTAQLSAVIEVVHRIQTKKVVSARTLECLRDFISGVRYDASLPIDAMAPAYAEAYERYYKPFFDQHPFILENYLSNYLLRTQFPLGPVPAGEPQTPLTAFFLMCLQFAVIKGLLIGMAGHYREAFSTDHVVKLIQCFSKQVEHSADLLDGLNKNLITAGGFALLLKN